jgi:hypothetical protein
VASCRGIATLLERKKCSFDCGRRGPPAPGFPPDRFGRDVTSAGLPDMYGVSEAIPVMS